MSTRGDARTLLAADYRTGERKSFTLRGDAVDLAPAGDSAPTDLVFGPGFLDLQCNGYAGVDFNSDVSTPEQIAESIRAMWAHGCTSVLPTLITADEEKLQRLFRKLNAAVGSDPRLERSVPGYHLEGPFISPLEGARGAHPLAAVRAPDLEFWRSVQTSAGGRICLVTLAPEIEGAVEFIEQLRRESVLPAIGHTMAGKAEISAALSAGAMMSTHLGNGCPQMVHRHHNPIFAQLGADGLAASVIADWIHLPPDVYRSLTRAKGTEWTVLVTDAMAAAGAPAGRYTIGEVEVEVGEDRIVRQPGSPNFAGSALTMNDAVANHCAMTGASLSEAWDAASVLPLRLLQLAGAACGVDLGTVVARWNGVKLEVVAALHDGRVLWST